MCSLSAGRFDNLHQGAFSEFDETTGWNNFALRNYDPQTARWTGADPYDQFPNPYTGMGNNPVNMVDPDGGASYQPPVPTGGWLQGVSGVLSNMASSYLLTTVTQQQTCPECLRIYEFLKYTEAGRQIGTLAGVGKWAGNTVKGTWNLYRMSLLTTPAYEKAEAVNQLFNTTKTALDYLSLPDYSRVSVATTYVSTKYNNYIRLNPYEQGVAFGEVAPNLLTTALPVMRLGRLGAAAKTVTQAEYTFTKTAAKHLTEVVKRGENAGQLARPYMNSPLTIQEIMSTGKGTLDATFKGGMNWRVPGTFRGSQGIWELGINPKTNVIYHFNFTHP